MNHTNLYDYSNPVLIEIGYLGPDIEQHAQRYGATTKVMVTIEPPAEDDLDMRVHQHAEVRKAARACANHHARTDGSLPYAGHKAELKKLDRALREAVEKVIGKCKWFNYACDPNKGGYDVTVNTNRGNYTIWYLNDGPMAGDFWHLLVLDEDEERKPEEAIREIGREAGLRGCELELFVVMSESDDPIGP